MKPLDNDLKNLLRRKDPPEGFAERVMARLATEPSRTTLAQRLSAIFRPPALRWAAVAAACVVVVLGIVRYVHQQRMQAQAELASAQATFALRITNEEIDIALRRAQNATLRALEFPKNPNSEME
jgi:multidrug efflux pump subunit AcrA (membrane-fusion protein)